MFDICLCRCYRILYVVGTVGGNAVACGKARVSRTWNRQSLELLEVRVLYLLLSLLLALYVISWQDWPARRGRRLRGFHPCSLLAAEGKIASPERQFGLPVAVRRVLHVERRWRGRHRAAAGYRMELVRLPSSWHRR